MQSYLGEQHEDQVEVLLLEGGDELVVHGQEVLGGVVGHEVARHQPRQAWVVQRELQQQRRLARGPRHKLLRWGKHSQHFSHKGYTQGFCLR